MRQRWPDVVSDVVLAVWAAMVVAQHAASVAAALPMAGGPVASLDLRVGYILLGLVVLAGALVRRCCGHGAHEGSMEPSAGAACAGRAASAQEVAGDR